MKYINIQVSEDEHRQLKQRSLDEGITISKIVRDAVLKSTPLRTHTVRPVEVDGKPAVEVKKVPEIEGVKTYTKEELDNMSVAARKAAEL